MMNKNQNYLYLISKLLHNIIELDEDKQEIYAVFNKKKELVTFSKENCFNKQYLLYKTTPESLYIFLRGYIYAEIDFILIKIIEKRLIKKLSIDDMAKTLKITSKDYISLEEGLLNLNEKQRKEIFKTLNIQTDDIEEYFNKNFKLMIHE